MERWDYDAPLPPAWTGPLVSACFEFDRDQEQRFDFVRLLGRLPAALVKEAVEERLELSYEVIRDLRMCGELHLLHREVDRQLPGYSSVKTVSLAVDAIVRHEVRLQASADLMFQGIDEAALDWLDNPEQVPEVYAIEGKMRHLLLLSTIYDRRWWSTG